MQHLGPVHVTFPSTVEELTRNAAGFEAFANGKHGRDTAGLPQIVAAADGTHIPIRKPDGSGDSFINRKGFFSINVHAMCDASMRYVDVICGYSGRCHDQRVFSEGKVSTSLHEGGAMSVLFRGSSRLVHSVMVPFMIIADSAYQATQFVLPALKEKSATTAQQLRFNKKHACTRNVIERSFGILKRRWQCLLKPLELNIHTIGDVVLSCFILHNVCIDKGEPMFDAELMEVVVDEYKDRCGEGAVDDNDVQGVSVRNAFIVMASTLQH